MLELDQNITIRNARTEFEEALGGMSHYVTPESISSDLDKQKQRFERLKFTYLEQEARDKFLRILLNEEQHDSSQIDADSDKLKQQLESLEEEVALKQTRLDDVTDELLELDAKQQSRMSELDDVVKQISDIENDINQGELSQYLLLLENVNMGKLHSEENRDSILEYIDNENNEMMKHAKLLEEKSDTVLQYKGTIEVQESTIRELEEKLRQLKEEVASIGDTATEEDPNSPLGNWLVSVNNLLSTFTNFRLDTAIQGDTIVLNFGKFEIKLNKYSLSIVETNANIDVPLYNISDNKVKLLQETIVKLLV